MSVGLETLSRTVSGTRPMVLAKDFDVCKRFYIELGFQPVGLWGEPRSSRALWRQNSSAAGRDRRDLPNCEYIDGI